MKPSFEHFDHTADMGLRIRAATLAELISPATDALYAAIGEVQADQTEEPVEFHLHGEDAATLLRDYLAELLHLFECRDQVVTDIEVNQFDANTLRVHATASGIDYDKSDLRREVKAITYHELEIQEINGGLEAAIIVDI